MTDPSTRSTADHDADVARARGAVRNTQQLYGRRPPQRGLGRTWRGFARRYGWRAYALPVLLVVTVAALLTTQTPGHNSPSRAQAPARHSARANSAPPQSAATPPPTAAPSGTLKADSGGKADPSVLKAAALPAGPAYTTKGTGTFRMLKGTSPVAGKGKLYRYSIEVENGVTGIDLDQFQRTVVSVLSDPRSWSGHGVALQRVDSGHIDFHVSMTSSLTVRTLCGYTIHAETSCYDAAGPTSKVNRVAFDDARWVRGAAAYVGDLTAYRTYMINHEDGHAIGHNHAHQCLPDGLAPVMMQQTFGLRSAATNKFCQANPWPYPTGVAGAPGAEQQDTDQNNEYGIGD